MSNKKNLLIYGSGTLAEIAGFYFKTDTDYNVIGFVDQPEFIQSKPKVLDLPTLAWDDALAKYTPDDIRFFIAIGYQKTNTVREERFNQIRNAGFEFASYVSSRATILTKEIGVNCLILENNVIQPFTRIGDNVVCWSGNHIGHHSVVEDHVFIASHAVISGRCVIGSNSFLGVNCCLHDGVRLGHKTVVGAGAIVTKSCEPRSVFIPTKTESRIIDRDII